MKRHFVLLASCVLLLFLAGCSTPGHRAEQRPAAFHRLAPDDQKLVLHGHVRAGLSKDAVYIAWGPPDWRTENGRGKQTAETWIYERQLSIYAPLGSYDQVYPSLGLYGPRFGYGTQPGFGYGGFANEGFLYPPRAIITDVRFKRADFIDDQLRSFEVRRGAHTLDIGEAAASTTPRGTLTIRGSARTLHGAHLAARKPLHHRGLSLAQRLHQRPRQSGGAAAHLVSRRHRAGNHRNC